MKEECSVELVQVNLRLVQQYGSRVIWSRKMSFWVSLMAWGFWVWSLSSSLGPFLELQNNDLVDNGQINLQKCIKKKKKNLLFYCQFYSYCVWYMEIETKIGWKWRWITISYKKPKSTRVRFDFYKNVFYSYFHLWKKKCNSGLVMNEKLNGFLLWFSVPALLKSQSDFLT